MNKYSITGISRAAIFSPNHTGNDTAIFTGAAGYLREKGHAVTVYSEQEMSKLSGAPPFVFAMLRSVDSLQRLKSWEEAGCISVNSAAGIENCGRERMTNLLVAHGVNYPESLIVDVNDNIVDRLGECGFSACWIKRGDVHAIHREDVTYARHPEEAQGMLAEYAARGIETAVINRHLEGDLIKFYGVRDTSFFYWFYPFDDNHSKFGFEKINGKASGIPFDKDELRAMCSRAADILGVDVYGGDCIVSADRSIRLIDFNDWPSFAPCRQAAIPVIGEKIVWHCRTH